MQSSRSAGAVSSAGAVLAAGAIAILSYDLGPHARHMGLHILAMNVAAPLLAALIVARWRVSGARVSLLWISTLAQIASLWAAHAPAVQSLALAHPAPQLAMHAALLLAALAFWTAMLSLSGAQRWHAIPALLLTGKLACLLAVLLVFAPRAIYGGHLHAAQASAQALADQHLAGLLMIAACPLSYLIAAIVITVQLIREPMRDVGWMQQPARAG